MQRHSRNTEYEGPLEHGTSSLPRLSVLSAPSSPPVTYESAFSEAWPSVARVVASELRRLQVPAHAIDDLVQATAEVVLRKRPPFAGADDLAPYARIVARHKALRWVRTSARETVGLPELPSVQSVPDAARLRLLAAGTLKAYERLEPVQRERLSRYLAGERAGNSSERARERKRIERIRGHMAQAIERIAAAVAGWRKFGDVVVRPELVAAAALAVVQAVGGYLVPSASAMSGAVGAPPVWATAAMGAVSVPPPERAVAPAPEPARAQAVVPARADGRKLEPPPPSHRLDEPVVVVTSPTGKRSGVATVPNAPEMPLVCLSGFVNACVAKPFTL